MLTRQRIVTYGIPTLAAATIAFAFGVHPWKTGDSLLEPKPEPVATDTHRVDLVFAVDTTGSMGGLLDGAKRTVWSIATHIRQIDPQADLHVGLVAYRDIGDEYVTKDFQLTSDMDGVFAELSRYRADGGGDTPEDVAAGLYDALHKMQWRPAAKKLVFLVGDAPPADRGDVPRFDVLAREAASMQITLNTIRCGGDAETQVAWQQIASLGHGEFSSISQDGGVQQVVTPYDQKLAELSATIDGTAVIAGEGARAVYDRNMAENAAAPAAAKADRAGYYATKGGDNRDDNDVVGQAMGAGSAAAIVDKIAPEALPADLREMPKAQLAQELDKRAAVRKSAQKEITELNKQRAKFLKDNAGPGAGFDAKVNGIVTDQLK
jgi:hypothetical protein